MTIWVTPPQYMTGADDQVPFPIDPTREYPKGAPIGEINYGQASTCFVFAFHDDAYPDEYPAFHNLTEISTTEQQSLLTAWQEHSEYISTDLLFADAVAPNSNSTGVPIAYSTFGRINEDLPSGLTLGSNGQVVGNLTIEESSKILFFKVQTTQLPEYAIDRTYYSYSHIRHGSDVYRIRSGISTPYRSSNLYPITSVWENVGQYSISTDIVERTFALILNERSSGSISFITDPELGTMKLGQSIGEEFNLIVEASANTGEDISYSLDPSTPIAPLDNLDSIIIDNGAYQCMPPGISLSADGIVKGTPGLTLAGDGVSKFQFNIVATTVTGATVDQLFTLNIEDGYIRNNVQVSLHPAREHEREWFDLIQSEAFSEVALYRSSDDRYGIQRYPKVFIKENLFGDLGKEYDTAGLALTNIKQYMNERFLDTNEIDLNVSNIKFKTALSTDGVPQYDIVYKELTALNRRIDISLESSVLDQDVLFSINGLKDKLDIVLGSNNIDPSDSRYNEDINDQGNYADSLPLWMVNPDTTVNGAIPGFYAVMPLVYLQPGEGAKFIAAALEQNLLSKFFNKPITFDTFVLEYTLYPSRRNEYVTLQ